MEIDPFIFRLYIYIINFCWLLCCMECNTVFAYSSNVCDECNFISYNCRAIIAALAGTSANIFDVSNIFGFLAIILAAVNIFGGFLVTQRMLQMYKKKKK